MTRIYVQYPVVERKIWKLEESSLIFNFRKKSQKISSEKSNSFWMCTGKPERLERFETMNKGGRVALSIRFGACASNLFVDGGGSTTEHADFIILKAFDY